ncbi:hypothetical protein CC77DRAFT_1035830 [Alternaria alternata]|uniref:Gfd2/YDR514C-like C-terminal domain-containing protein n=1 Tax=Alternaria alternata TaxID=5599 RepID=A0A177D470_ALTAL|nr:hypothetical protein CC77DRAFT_1035830 [Alternaria alternata]OAG14201.1 hypothetical protein CC77DRAFT_1035830 [Alternaria alternata]RYO12882.1 hypothetical protein AA0121_g8858 [Alternaria tenuissima]RYO48677.1 hypothetical protein AA0116_g12501 [Alternaria tenuissima]
MASARLQRLQRFVQVDLDALPDRPISPRRESKPEPEPNHANSNSSGGVSLRNMPPDSPASKQTSQNRPVAAIKTPPTENTERRFVWIKDADSSFNPTLDSMRPSTAQAPAPRTDAAGLPVSNLQRGDLASPRHHFTPIQALAKYPYKYCNKIHMQDIASAFFDQGKFWQREWDLYYIWDIEETSKPFVLVRESQVQALLAEINKHLKLTLRVTDQQREEGLLVQFPDHPRCLPRYLGRSQSREDVDSMAGNAPNNTFRAAGEASHPPLESHTLERFRQLMANLAEAQKAKSKANKQKKQEDRMAKNKSMQDQFKRAGRYLGVRGSIQASSSSSSYPAIDPSMPVPFPFDHDVVFVCVDVESYERAHHKITEVGVATLDTRELIGVPPGENGAAWRNKIRARHFRINEYKHLRNTEFVTGYPDGFDFGESTFIPLKAAADHVAACFHAPFGAQDGDGFPSHHDPTEKRNIIFLGHDTLGDVRYLQQLGYDPMKVEHILEAMDTATMYKVWNRDPQPTSLGRILLAFDIPGWKLHNAGNDAVYTVQAMLGICVKEATLRGSPELDDMRKQEKENRLRARIEEAEQKAKDEAEGWSDHEAVGDGGSPIPLASAIPPVSKPVQTKAKPVPQYDGAGEDHIGPSRGREAPGEGRGQRERGDRGSDQRGTSSEHGQVDSGGRGQSSGSERSRGRARNLVPGRDRGRGRSGLLKEEAVPNVQYHW